MKKIIILIVILLVLGFTVATVIKAVSTSQPQIFNPTVNQQTDGADTNNEEKETIEDGASEDKDKDQDKSSDNKEDKQTNETNEINETQNDIEDVLDELEDIDLEGELDNLEGL
ncbi:MAG: hypothetical protein ACE5DX_04875 [Candidatus Dojkabacteria bacterium]